MLRCAVRFRFHGYVDVRLGRSRSRSSVGSSRNGVGRGPSVGQRTRLVKRSDVEVKKYTTRRMGSRSRAHGRSPRPEAARGPRGRPSVSVVEEGARARSRRGRRRYASGQAPSQTGTPKRTAGRTGEELELEELRTGRTRTRVELELGWNRTRLELELELELELARNGTGTRTRTGLERELELELEKNAKA